MLGHQYPKCWLKYPLFASYKSSYIQNFTVNKNILMIKKSSCLRVQPTMQLVRMKFSHSTWHICHIHVSPVELNSLAPGKFELNFRHVIFKQILVIDGWGISCEIPLKDQSTLVQVIAWCHQATSHYLSQCWPRFLQRYGVTRPQWVKITSTSGLFQFQPLLTNAQEILQSCTEPSK